MPAKTLAKSSLTVPSRSYAPGTRTVTIPDITTDDNGIKIALTRESWPDTGGDVITGQIDGSDDGGATWYNLTVFGYPGGEQINPRTGQVVTSCGPSVSWPERYVDGVTIPQRPQQVRAILTNLVTLTTAITLTGT
jgi:hypothetical protein